MKGKLGFFIFGLFIGALLTVFIFLVYSVGYFKMQPDDTNDNTIISEDSKVVSQQKIEGMNIFEKEGDAIPSKQIRVFQTLSDDFALAESTNEKFEYTDGYSYLNSIVVLLFSDGDRTFYDDLKIDIPADKQLIQVGTYRYQTVNKEFEQWKTVPIVIIK